MTVHRGPGKVALFLCAAAVASLMGSPLAAQDDTAAAANPEKAAVDLEIAKETLAKARQDQLLAILGTVKPAAEGKVEIKTAGDSAEALILWRNAAREAVEQIAAVPFPSAMPLAKPDLGCGNVPKPDGIILVQSAHAPDVTQWLAFREGVRRYESDLKAQIDSWKKAEADKGGAEPSGHPFAFVPAAVAIAATVLPLFKTDYVIEGTKITVGSDELRAILSENIKLNFDNTDLLVADAPSDVETVLDDTRKLRAAAQGLLDKYASTFFKDKTKPTDAIKQANAALKTLVAQYDGFEKTLYTPVDGALPAIEVARQKRVWCHRDTARILYILSARASLTTVTKKNLFIGMSSKPATLRMAVVIDYAMGVGRRISFGTAHSISTAMPFDGITALKP